MCCGHPMRPVVEVGPVRRGRCLVALEQRGLNKVYLYGADTTVAVQRADTTVSVDRAQGK